MFKIGHMSAEAIVGRVDPLRLYLDEIGKYELLTAEQERDLSYKIIEGRQAWDLLENSKLASETESLQLEQTFLSGLEARTTFINSNLRLVVSVAKGFTRYIRTSELLDLIQEGNIGLEHAVEKFDPSKGFKFSTYGTWWIKQSIKKYINSGDTVVRIPTNLGGEIISSKINNRVLTAKQSAAYAVANVVSFDMDVSDDSKATLLDLLPDPDSNKGFEKVETALDALTLRGALESLSPRERVMIELHFGIADGDARSFSEIGRIFGLTGQGASRVVNVALRKLRSTLKANV